MATPRPHDELIELTGAYALDALEPDEASTMEAHLRECPRCRAEVQAFHEAAALLAHVSSDPPDGLWDRIAGALDAGASDVAPIPFIARPPRSRRLLWAAAAALIVAVAVNGAVLVRQNDQLERLRAENAKQVNLERVALAAATDPNARVAELKSKDGRAAAKAVILPDGRGYLIAEDLPKLDAAHTYQLWGRVPGVDTAISLGVLGTSPRVVAFAATAPFTRLGISIEPSGGSPTSSGIGAGGGDVVPRPQDS